MSQLLPTPATPLCDIGQCLSSLVHFLYCAVRAWIPVSPGLEGSLRGLMLWLSSCTRWERVTEDRRDMGSPVGRLGEPCREVKGHSISRAVPKRPHGQGCVSPKHPVQPTQTSQTPLPGKRAGLTFAEHLHRPGLGLYTRCLRNPHSSIQKGYFLPVLQMRRTKASKMESICLRPRPQS